MLLAEGMNVKVLLLPDGKDPDEFARSYSAEDFRKYIEDNQTDFIVFKINVLLKGVTDPIKRSEAVGSIVQSISVIKDPILRDTYIRECANRTGVSERTLMEQMNRNIYSNREQQTREQQQHRAAVMEEQREDAMAIASKPTTSKVEQMLIQAVVKDGEKVIFRDVKDENSGETYNLTVAQYIAYDLGSDNLGFSNELYTKILQEAVEHCGEEGFKAEEYFTQHADINIASVAVRLSVDRFQLAESLQVKETEQTLRDRVIHLVADFRLEYVSSHLKELNERLLQVKDPQEMQEIMSEIMRTQNLRNELAKKTGSNIPFVWISPSNWNGDTGINDVIKENVGKGHFFDSRNLKLKRGSDHYHPTWAAAAYWMDTAAKFIRSKECANPLQLNNPKAHHKATNTKLLQPSFEGY